MRKFEVITKSTNTAKLTITKDRVTIKVPENTTLADTERLVKFFKKIADKHPSPQATLRGNNDVESVLKYGIGLYAGVHTNRNGILISNHQYEE